MKYKAILIRPKATVEETRKYVIHTDSIAAIKAWARELFKPSSMNLLAPRIPESEWPECEVRVYEYVEYLKLTIKAEDT